MGSDKIGPKEMQQRILRDRTYAGKNERAAAIDGLKGAMEKTISMVKSKPAKKANRKNRR
jgi:hypothetical protein